MPGARVQPALGGEHAGVLGGQRLGAVQRLGRLAQPADRDQRVAEADQRVQMLRLRRDDRL